MKGGESTIEIEAHEVNVENGLIIVVFQEDKDTFMKALELYEVQHIIKTEKQFYGVKGNIIFQLREKTRSGIPGMHGT